MSKNKSALVLFSFKSHKHGYIERLFEILSQRAEKYNLHLSRGSLKDLHISVKNNTLQITESLTGKDLQQFDVVYFELWYKSQQQALAAALYCQQQRTPFFSKELLYMVPLTKVGEIAKLASTHIPLPNTLTSSHLQLKSVFKTHPPFPYPFVLKAADGYGGKCNFLIKDYKHLKDTLKEHKDVTFIAQEFIPNDCDYRCLVFGGEVKLVLKRSRTNQDTHLNNTSQGAEGEVVPVNVLPQVALDDVVKAAKRLNRSEFAGVDLIINTQTGQHYVLEVNQTPQIEIGAAVEAKMEALLGYMEGLAYGS